MKKWIVLIIAAAQLFCCSACGSHTPAATPETAPEPTETPAVSAAVTEPEPVPEATEAPDDSASASGPAGEAPAFAPDFTFTTTDRNGEAYDESVFAGQTLTMINFWEPWCGPCVREMPDLEKLYQDYRDRGFLILGVYSTPGMEEDVDAVLEQTGVTYPILHYTAGFEAFESGFVPTTIFVDGEGHILRHAADPELLKMFTQYAIEGAGEKAEILYVGGNDYAGWESIVQEGMP